MMFPKHNYIRSKKLLENARQIPCQWCGADDGTIVAAHTNWGGGKGRGIKADDNLIASLCYSCHGELDQGAMMTKGERKACGGLLTTGRWRSYQSLGCGLKASQNPNRVCTDVQMLRFSDNQGIGNKIGQT